MFWFVLLVGLLASVNDSPIFVTASWSLVRSIGRRSNRTLRNVCRKFKVTPGPKSRQGWIELGVGSLRTTTRGNSRGRWARSALCLVVLSTLFIGATPIQPASAGEIARVELSAHDRNETTSQSFRYDAPLRATTADHFVTTNTPGPATAADVESTFNGLPKGKSPGVRTVDSVGELNQTFDSMTQGGTPSSWPGYKGKVVRLPDGTEVGLRTASKSGGETIDIRVPGQAPTKVHIK